MQRCLPERRDRTKQFRFLPYPSVDPLPKPLAWLRSSPLGDEAMGESAGIIRSWKFPTSEHSNLVSSKYPSTQEGATHSFCVKRRER